MARVSSGARASSCLAKLITEKPISKFCFTTNTAETTRVPSFPPDNPARCTLLLLARKEIAKCQAHRTSSVTLSGVLHRRMIVPAGESRERALSSRGRKSREMQRGTASSNDFAALSGLPLCRIRCATLGIYDVDVNACGGKGICPVVTRFELQRTVARNPSETLLHLVRCVTSAIRPLNEIYMRTTTSLLLQSYQSFWHNFVYRFTFNSIPSPIYFLVLSERMTRITFIC